jgi:2'-5' RNA ligase
MATIGVAIAIPPPYDSVLNDARAGSGDPLAPYIPAHLTLLGPTEIDMTDMQAVEVHLSKVATEHHIFEVHLRGTGTFRPVTEVVFVAIAAGISDCEQLAAAVRSGVLTRELHYPYHPHITVAHDVPSDALDRVYGDLADFDVELTFDHFTLYVHGDDGRWRPIRDFPLAARDSSATMVA